MLTTPVPDGRRIPSGILPDQEFLIASLIILSLTDICLVGKFFSGFRLVIGLHGLSCPRVDECICLILIFAYDPLLGQPSVGCILLDVGVLFPAAALYLQDLACIDILDRIKSVTAQGDLEFLRAAAAGFRSQAGRRRADRRAERLRGPRPFRRTPERSG